MAPEHYRTLCDASEMLLSDEAVSRHSDARARDLAQVLLTAYREWLAAHPGPLHEGTPK